MSGNSVAIRLSAEGGDAVVRALQDIGRAAQTEFEKAAKASRSATPGVRAFSEDLDKLDGKLNDNSKRQKFSRGLDEISYGLYQVGSAVPAAYQPIMALTDSLDALAYGSGAGRLGMFAGGVAAAAAALIGLGAAGNAALTELAKLDEAMTKTGASGTEIRGFELIGARSGVGQEAARGALDSAAQQFEQFKRNAGGVKDEVEKIDEAFLKTLDRTRALGEFMDAIGQKIRTLPREEGMDLAKALLGDDSGQKLYDAIMRGETAMSNLRKTADDAGVSVRDGAAREAGELQRKVDEASQVARDRLLGAFNDLAPVVAQVKIDFWDAVAALDKWVQPIKDAWGWAQKIADTLNFINAKAQYLGAASGGHAAGDVAQPNPQIVGPLDGQGAANPFGNLSNPFEAPMPPVRPGGLGGVKPAGVSRARYAARDADGGAGKATEDEKDNSEAVIHNLEMQLKLAQSVGDAHREIANQIQIERNLKQANVELDSEEGRRIAELTRQIDEATEATRRQKDEQAQLSRASRDFSQMISSGLSQATLEGKRLSEVLDGILKRLASKGIDSLVGSVFDSFFGVGKGGGGGVGGGGGFLDFLKMLIPKFAEGGLLAPGAIGLGGEAGFEILTRPTLVRGPAAFAPLSKFQAQAGSAPKVVINNLHAGADVDARVTPEGVEVMIDRKVSSAFSAYDAHLEPNLRDKGARAW